MMQGTGRPLTQAVPTKRLTSFAADVLRGLSSTPKFLSSKYFYDDEGTRLFQEIMRLPEYYLTGCEYEIFSQQAGEIYEAFSGRDASVNERADSRDAQIGRAHV